MSGTKRRLEQGAGVGVAFVLAFAAVAILRADGAVGPSFWQYLMSEGVTRAAVRLLVVAVSLYAIVSVPFLVFRGRWIRSVGPSGLTVEDDAARADEIVKLSRAVADLVRGLDEREALRKGPSGG